MNTDTQYLHEVAESDYEHGWVTEIEADTIPKGLSEAVVRLISAKKDEPAWMLEWRLRAFRHWQTLVADTDKYPRWAHLEYPDFDFQSISYYSAPNSKPKYDSIDEVDPELLRTFERLGIPLEEQKMLAGVAVDAVFDSVSVATTLRKHWQNRGSSSARSPKRCRNTPSWCASTWVQLSLTLTIFSPV